MAAKQPAPKRYGRKTDGCRFRFRGTGCRPVVRVPIRGVPVAPVQKSGGVPSPRVREWEAAGEWAQSAVQGAPWQPARTPPEVQEVPLVEQERLP
jgi:hypothetical protein